MKVLPMLLVFAAVAFVSCERHDWEETKKLHEPHGASHGHAPGHDAGNDAEAHAPAGQGDKSEQGH